MRFLFNWIHENAPMFIVAGIIAVMMAGWFVAKEGAAPIIENIGKYNKQTEYADVYVYDGMEVNAATVTSFVKDHYNDDFIIMVDSFKVDNINFNSLKIGTNTKYMCTVTSTVDGINTVLFQQVKQPVVQ